MSRIVVIGGGVVGISCALALQEDGHSVTVLDPGPVGAGASAASCGCIAAGEVVPLSEPGTLWKVPGWLLNPDGPLAIRPASALQMLPWFMRFLGNATPNRTRAIAKDMAQLTFAATEDFQRQMTTYGIRDMLVDRPVLKLFANDREKAGMAPGYALAREMGCTIDEITGAEAREMEPAIAAGFPHAAVLRDWRHVANTTRLVTDLHAAFTGRGGVVQQARAIGFVMSGGGVQAVRVAAGTPIPADEVVIAAGSQSKQLAAELGVSLPLAGLMGYWTGLPTPGVDLKHTVFSVSGGFGITPYENELGIAGTVEFAGPRAAPNWRRATILVDQARRILPGLQTDGAQQRVGRRPFMPDTQPVIGRSRRCANVTFATGHGQLGVTLAATTGRLVAATVAARPLNLDLAAFSPDRFAL